MARNVLTCVEQRSRHEASVLELVILEDQLQGFPQDRLGILCYFLNLSVVQAITEMSREAEIKLIEGGADIVGYSLLYTSFKLSQSCVKLFMGTLVCPECTNNITDQDVVSRAAL